MNPPLDDEVLRRHFWEQSLNQHRDKLDVVRNAASALALRDAEIARLRAMLQEKS